MVQAINISLERDIMAEETGGSGALDQQIERFLAAFHGIRMAMAVDFKRSPQQQGFSATQFMLMGFLHHAQEAQGEPFTISLLANKLGLDPATVVRTVDSLEKRGLVERRRSSQDRRQVFVELTASGRAVREEVSRRVIERVKTIFSAMSEEGRVALIRGLEEFVHVGQEVGGEHSASTKGETDGC